MRLIIAVRLATGLRASVSSGIWKPSGSPAIYKLLEYLQHSSHDVQLLLLDREPAPDRCDREIRLEGLAMPVRQLSSPAMLRLLPRRLRTIATELSETLLVWQQVRQYAPDAIYCDRSLLWPAGLLARFGRWPVVWRVLGISPNLQEALSGNSINHRIMRWLMRSPFAIAICSRDGSGGDAWLPRLLSPEVPRAVLLNGVDSLLDTADLHIDLPPNKTVVTFLGRLEEIKNLRLFVAGFATAVAEEKNLHALIVGDGDERAWLLQRLQADDGSHFTFIPRVAHSQVPKILAKTDIYVSLNAMGNLSNANLEAIRTGVCMVIPEADSTNARDIDTAQILPADTALRVALDERALAAALVRLHRDPVERQARATATVRLGAQLKTWTERIVEEIGMIQKAISRQRQPGVTMVISDLQGGGAQRVLCLLATELAARQHKISVVTLSPVNNDIFRLPDSVQRVALDLKGESRNGLSGIIANIRRIFALRRALKTLRTDTAVSFIGSTNILTILASICTPWSIVVSERNDPARQSLGRMWDILRRRLYPCADLVTANSSGALSTMARWMPVERLKLVHNPIPVANYSNGSCESRISDRTILAVCRLHHQKALDVLLDAFALLQQDLPEWKLMIAGTGPLEQTLRQQARQLGIAEKVTWPGFVSDPSKLYSKASIFALPSRHEGMPNALLEAMAAGCACVVSDASSGPLELITDGKSGLVCATDDSRSLAAALLRLASDPSLRLRLGAAAQERAGDFDLEHVADQWEQMLGLNVANAPVHADRNLP